MAKKRSGPRTRGASELAEGVGFEPTVGFPTLDFESSALNRTQPPFLEREEKRGTSNVQHPTLNATVFEIVRSTCSALDVERLHPLNPAGPPNAARFQASECMNPQSATDEAKKCYNFKLAKPVARTASCISTRTATLLLVVDWYSQVLGAAVYEYAQLISNLNPPLRP